MLLSQHCAQTDKCCSKTGVYELFPFFYSIFWTYLCAKMSNMIKRPVQNKLLLDDLSNIDVYYPVLYASVTFSLLLCMS